MKFETLAPQSLDKYKSNTDNNNYFTNKIIGIREEKDCSDIEKNIKFVNCGIYQIAVKNLIDLIPLITASLSYITSRFFSASFSFFE